MLHNSGVPGDFLEAGVWRGGASIFAAGVLRHAQSERHVWVCDSFQGFDLKAWDGDSGWSVLNSIVAVSLDDVRQNFENYGLLDEDKIHFVKGFFVDSLPDAAVEKIALLRLDGDLFSSTSDILYNLYGKISIGGVIIVDDFGIEACQRAVLDFRRIHGIDDDLVPIDASGAVWWIKKERTTPRSEVYRRMLSALEDAVAAGQHLRIGLEWLSPHNRCHISGPCDADPLGYKSVAGKHSTWDDSREAYQNLIVADNEGACHARARAWHAVCNNSAASSVTATFLPKASSRTYPPISSRREPSQEEASNLSSGSPSTPSPQQTASLDCSLLLDQQILVFDPDLRFDQRRSSDLSVRANEMVGAPLRLHLLRALKCQHSGCKLRVNACPYFFTKPERNGKCSKLTVFWIACHSGLQEPLSMTCHPTQKNCHQCAWFNMSMVSRNTLTCGGLPCVGCETGLAFTRCLYPNAFD